MRAAALAAVLFIIIQAPAVAQRPAAMHGGLSLAESTPAGTTATPAIQIGVVGSSLGSHFQSPSQTAAVPVWSAPSRAGEMPQPTHVDPHRVATIGLATGSMGAAVFAHQRSRSWVNRQPRFRILNDWEYARWADKAGHFVAAAFFTRSYRSSLRWAGLSGDDALLWGAGAAWMAMLYAEVLDGFGSDYGFSPGDLLFNTLGVAFASGQYAWEPLRAFEMRVGYWPSGLTEKPWFEDYAGQTYWLSVSPAALGATRSVPWFPSWLGVAAGYAARDPDEYLLLQTSVFLVGLDVDLGRIPIRHPAWRALVSVLRYIRIPAPAVRLTQGVRFIPFAY
jgi:hypothetical protein